MRQAAGCRADQNTLPSVCVCVFLVNMCFAPPLPPTSYSVLRSVGTLLQTMVMCMSLGYIGFVALLHIIGKVRLPVPLCSA